MNLWRKSASPRRTVRLKHDFVIGPRGKSDLFARPARLYYCIRCKWSFMVCGSTVAVLDEDGSPVVGDESLRRFNTLAEGPCPVLEAFVSAALADADALRPPSRSKRDEPRNPAPGHPSWSGWPRPPLRVFTRLRENPGR
jgi:hypothetical protein